MLVQRWAESWLKPIHSRRLRLFFWRLGGKAILHGITGTSAEWLLLWNPSVAYHIDEHLACGMKTLKWSDERSSIHLTPAGRLSCIKGAPLRYLLYMLRNDAEN